MFISFFLLSCVYTMQPVVQPVVQRVASCLRGFSNISLSDYYFVCAIGCQHDGYLPFWLPGFIKLIMLLSHVLFAVAEINILLLLLLQYYYYWHGRTPIEWSDVTLASARVIVVVVVVVESQMKMISLNNNSMYAYAKINIKLEKVTNCDAL